jgi:hypothetical protein
MMTIDRLSGSTTIGSLPHHNVDAALACSFRTAIPFLPQIPIRNSWEYMIAQALEGLPGLQIDTDGTATINLDVWSSRSHSFSEKLGEAFALAERPDAFEAFEPSAATSSCWQPFLWELRERESKVAKIQIAGPMTSQWALRIAHSKDQELPSELSAQIYRLVLARALAMTRRVRAAGAHPILFIDEPGLYGLDIKSPKHWQGFQELRLMIQTIKKSGATVALHCCSNTDWPAVLGLELDILSIDAALSLKTVLTARRDSRSESYGFDEFVEAGGRLALGVIPTNQATTPARSESPKAVLAQVIETFSKHAQGGPKLARQVLSTAIWTPACGLALHSVDAADDILDSLLEFDQYAAEAITKG